ncbi:MAG TPA: hypothetical protein VJ812_11540 [Gemmatimonadaceae bacterium]|nr:hypothetical protein [Gemmatimonadaceae bacterium]
MIARGARIASLLVLLAAVAAPAGAQTVPVRFEVAAVADSMMSFALPTPSHAKWVRPGIDGIVVDPARRDALVASFRVVTVSSVEVTGVVTGQTTRVEPGQIAILNRPSRAWYARGSFWGGLLLGAAAGLIIGAQ